MRLGMLQTQRLDGKDPIQRKILTAIFNQKTSSSKKASHRPQANFGLQNPLLVSEARQQQVLLDERRESSLQASSSGLEHATTSNLLTRKKTLSPPKLLKPVEVVRTITDQPQVSYEEAVVSLTRILDTQLCAYKDLKSAVIRIEVPISTMDSALDWLKGQTALRDNYPNIYFSRRFSSAPITDGILAADSVQNGTNAIAGVASAWTWQGSNSSIDECALKNIQAFLDVNCPRIRALGGSRFDTSRMPSSEWQEFGSFMFMIPRLEYLEAGNCNLLACTLAWHYENNSGQFSSFDEAYLDCKKVLNGIQPSMDPNSAAFKIQRGFTQQNPNLEGWVDMMQPVHDVLRESNTSQSIPKLEPIDGDMALQEYESHGQGGLDALIAALDAESTVTSKEDDINLTKTVLARRTDISMASELDSLGLLQTLQERDPRAFQLYLRLPSGATFMGSTPELLYERSGRNVATEAVAGTRPRGPPGDVQKDFWLAFDLLRNPKDHAEFCIVRDWIYSSLKGLCEEIALDTEKSVLKQGVVQHLYGRISGFLKENSTDADLLAALHPTPAVCGRPRDMAKALVHETEPFDRGFYSGPFGWISGDSSEFAVAIRSALIHPEGSFQSKGSWNSDNLVYGDVKENFAHNLSQEACTQNVSLYAGVGIVRGSIALSEWQELDLKVSQFDRLLSQPLPFRDLPNINLASARLMIEELCRLGVNTFCIAPGSRSSTLTTAVSMQPTARIIPCIDERSLAFWALGYGRASGMPAVIITSSGTAVANLLPAIVESSQSRIPLIILSADRPVELRETSANQTIDQVKIFGGYTSWAMDLPPPDSSTPLKHFVTTIDSAFRHSLGPISGPVHLNCQYREPLSPKHVPWDSKLLKGLQEWEISCKPFTEPLNLPLSAQRIPSGLVSQLRSCTRGMAVVGEQLDQSEALACAKIAEKLGWPLIVDVLSGLKVGQQKSLRNAILHMDSILLCDETTQQKLKPDIILQFGGRLTSKRQQKFLEMSANDSSNPAKWIFVDEAPSRQDPGHCVSVHIQAKPSQFAEALQRSI